MANTTDLFPALVECFAIILCGYLAGRLSIITPSQAKGVGNFVGTFALPALLFRSMVELNFSSVNWTFVLAVFIGKSLVFFLVFVVSLIVLREQATARGALYSIFATQSNDFALGYPLLEALYRKTNPEFLQYIYLVAPISLMILNPIGFVMLEIDKHRSVCEIEITKKEDVNRNSEDELNKLNGRSDTIHISEDDNKNKESHTRVGWKLILNVVKGVLLNPLVFMVFIGLIFHFILRGTIPKVVYGALNTLAKAFSGTALFYLGLTMVGKIGNQYGSKMILPVLLIVAKIILLPILIRELVLGLGGVLPGYNPLGIMSNSSNSSSYLMTLADYGYLYGTFPTAPTIAIYATKYGIEVDRLATGMVFCTSLSAPIMFVSAWTLSMNKMSIPFFQKEVKQVNEDISVISLFCSVWCIAIFLLGRKIFRVPHIITFSLIVSYFLSSLMTILWDDPMSVKWSATAKYVIFYLMYFSIKNSRILTASLAVSLVCGLIFGTNWLWKNTIYFIAVPTFVSIVLALLVVLCGTRTAREDKIMEFGMVQIITSFIVLLLCFVICILSLLAIMKYRRQSDVNSTDHSSEESQSLLLQEHPPQDLSSTEDEETCVQQKIPSFVSMQLGRHIVLLLLLSLSIFIGMCLTVWKLSNMEERGVYFEIAFLDSVFNFGQPFFVFCVFGLDSDLVIDPVVRFYRKIRFGSGDISLSPLAQVEKRILRRCLKFTRHHIDDCRSDICYNRQVGLSDEMEVFSGKDFCTWLIDRGIAQDRVEACIYGQNLMEGRVISHRNNKHYFHDQNYVYKFEERKLERAGMQLSVLTPTDSENTPTTSSYLTVSSRRITSTLSRREVYQGYSFENYISLSDIDSNVSTPRRHVVPLNDTALLRESANNKSCIVVENTSNIEYSDGFESSDTSLK